MLNCMHREGVAVKSGCSWNRWKDSKKWFVLHLFFSFIFISWRLITLQYCSGFCHTLTWISHGFTCIPHPDVLHLDQLPRSNQTWNYNRHQGRNISFALCVLFYMWFPHYFDTVIISMVVSLFFPKQILFFSILSCSMKLLNTWNSKRCYTIK